MAQKVYTLEIVNEKKSSTAKKSVTPKTVKSSAVEAFGVAEINNASAKKRVKNTKELGYEKNVSETLKKPVKMKVQEVDDYFDFCFKTTKNEVSTKKAEVVKTVAQKVDESQVKPAQKKTAVTKKASSKKTADETLKKEEKPKLELKTTRADSKKLTTAKKTKEKTSEPVVKKTTKKATTKATKTKAEITAEAEVVKVKTEISSFEAEQYDDEISKIVSIARMGTLFDCEKGCF